MSCTTRCLNVAVNAVLAIFGVGLVQVLFVQTATDVVQAGHAVDSEQQQVDIGLFARVVASDPNRNDGAQSGRLQEFRAEDVFLTTKLFRDSDGTYTVPTFQNGWGCIGLEWAERRMLTKVALQFDRSTEPISSEDVEIQYWSSSGRDDSWGTVGQTPWQGEWKVLPGRIQTGNGQWSVSISAGDVPEFRKGGGVLRIRWLFPRTSKPIKIRQLSAYGTARWAVGEFRVEMAPEHNDGSITVGIYNGLLLDKDGTKEFLRHTWNPAVPHRLRIRYSVPRRSKADRTLLRFKLPNGALSVAVEDLLGSDGVYVEDYGLFVVRQELATSLTAFRERIADRKGILERVRALPDQTLDQAMKVLWRPAQNHGPTMLSLACDNHKLIVQRNGEVEFEGLKVSPRFASTNIELVRMDWGQIGVDTSVRPPAGEPLPLRLTGETFQKGIGMHANAELAVQLNGQYATFEALVGVYPSDAAGGTVNFQVFVDGQKKFDSGLMRQRDPSKPVRVPVTGANRMVLKVTDAGDGISNDAGNWADACLIPTRPNESQSRVYLSDLYTADQRCGMPQTRRLEGQWLPIVVNTVRNDQLTIRQRTFVTPFDRQRESATRFGMARPLGIVDFIIENRMEQQANADFEVRFRATAANAETLRLQQVENRVLVTCDDMLLACVDTSDIAGLQLSVQRGTLKLAGMMRGVAPRHLTVYIPAWEMRTDQHCLLPGRDVARADVESYWHDMMARTMRVDVPSPLIENVFRATQVHCLMAARNEAEGRLIEPWVASAYYGPLDTEAQAVVLGMDLLGHHEFARRSIDMFVASYRENGMLAKGYGKRAEGYTLIGLGQHLWTLGEHYALTRDKAWLKQIAPKLLRACRWIERQTEKTKRRDRRGHNVPEYGLVPPGVLADWDRYAYYMYANAHYCAGARAVASLLAEIGHPAAGELAAFAEEYRGNILRAYQWNQARMPVVSLRDGTYVPPTVSSLYTYGLTRDYFGGASAIGHDVEVGGNHLIPLGLLDPKSRRAEWIVNYMEDRWFYIDGVFGAYPAATNEKDWFNYGGFAKLQPHYARTADIHALRDDVKPFIRTYFNTFPVLLNRENLTYWEHFNHGGGWNKTHESAWFLQMTRTMLVMERGDELWLAPFVTSNWLHDGMVVSVRNAPTRFGRLSYTIHSSVRRGHIDAVIDPLSHTPPHRIVLRIRHPEGKPIREVTVNGAVHHEFDATRDTVSIQPQEKRVTIVARF